MGNEYFKDCCLTLQSYSPRPRKGHMRQQYCPKCDSFYMAAWVGDHLSYTPLYFGEFHAAKVQEFKELAKKREEQSRLKECCRGWINETRASKYELNKDYYFLCPTCEDISHMILNEDGKGVITKVFLAEPELKIDKRERKKFIKNTEFHMPLGKD